MPKKKRKAVARITPTASRAKKRREEGDGASYLTLESHPRLLEMIAKKHHRAWYWVSTAFPEAVAGVEGKRRGELFLRETSKTAKGEEGRREFRRVAPCGKLHSLHSWSLCRENKGKRELRKTWHNMGVVHRDPEKGAAVERVFLSGDGRFEKQYGYYYQDGKEGACKWGYKYSHDYRTNMRLYSKRVTQETEEGVDHAQAVTQVVWEPLKVGKEVETEMLRKLVYKSGGKLHRRHEFGAAEIIYPGDRERMETKIERYYKEGKLHSYPKNDPWGKTFFSPAVAGYMGNVCIYKFYLNEGNFTTQEGRWYLAELFNFNNPTYILRVGKTDRNSGVCPSVILKEGRFVVMTMHHEKNELVSRLEKRTPKWMEMNCCVCESPEEDRIWNPAFQYWEKFYATEPCLRYLPREGDRMAENAPTHLNERACESFGCRCRYWFERKDEFCGLDPLKFDPQKNFFTRGDLLPPPPSVLISRSERMQKAYSSWTMVYLYSPKKRLEELKGRRGGRRRKPSFPF